MLHRDTPNTPSTSDDPRGVLLVHHTIEIGEKNLSTKNQHFPIIVVPSLAAPSHQRYQLPETLLMLLNVYVEHCQQGECQGGSRREVINKFLYYFIPLIFLLLLTPPPSNPLLHLSFLLTDTRRAQMAGEMRWGSRREGGKSKFMGNKGMPEALPIFCGDSLLPHVHPAWGMLRRGMLRWGCCLGQQWWEVGEGHNDDDDNNAAIAADGEDDKC
jgi:hypothetical protein